MLMPAYLEPAPRWAETIDGWLAALKAAGYSKHTLTTRRCQLTRLSLDMPDIPPDVVDAGRLVAWMAAHDWKPETRKSMRNALGSFFGWMQQTGRRADDPSSGLPSVRRPQAHPRPCPDNVIVDAYRRADAQTRLMLRLGAECGLRRGEIAAVNRRDLRRDLLGWSLTVTGKGDKQRVVPLDDGLAESIMMACDESSGWLFPGRFGGHVENTYVGKRLSAVLGDGWTAHSLRHRYASRTYAATHDLLLVGVLLGHESVETTQRYVLMPDDRLRAAMVAVGLAV